MADVEVSYKGSTIGSLSATGSLTLETEGKYCEADIGIEYTSPGAIDGDNLEYGYALVDSALVGTAVLLS